MSRFDRYMLSQLLALFGFFSLLLVLIYWVNRAVGLFDQLIGDGQTVLVFLEISLLSLPNLIRIVLPVSAFAATVYVTNRLTQDGELVVMQATGFSAFRLARPVFYFGVLVAIMISVLMHLIVPASRITMADRTAEIGANITAQLLSDGRFMHPSDGITFYIREIKDTGELLDVFLTDSRTPGIQTTYTARRALMVRGDTAPKLIMFDGMTQTYSVKSGRLSVTLFADATYEMNSIVASETRTNRSIDELSTGQLLRPTDELIVETGTSRAAFLSDGHSRFSQPLLAPAATLIGFATLLIGAFSRFGLWRQILAAVVLLILMQMVSNAGTSASLRDPALWPLVYLAPVGGIVTGISILWYSQLPRRKTSRFAGRLT